MKKMIKKAICLIAVSFLVVSSAGYAQPACDADGKSWQQDKAERFEKVSEELGLNEQQKEALKAHFSEEKEKMKGLRSSLENTRKALKEELKKYNSDNLEIGKITAQMKELEAKKIDYRVQGFLKMKEILTEEQFNKFSAYMDKMRKHKKRNGKKRNKFVQE